MDELEMQGGVEEPTQEGAVEDQNGADAGAVGDGAGADAGGGKEKPLTQEAFNKQYRAAREAEEKLMMSEGRVQRLERELNTMKRQQMENAYRGRPDARDQRPDPRQMDMDPELAEMMKDPVLRPLVQSMERRFQAQLERTLGPLTQKFDSMDKSFRERQEQAAYEQERSSWENEFNSYGTAVATGLNLKEKFADAPELGDAILGMALSRMDGLIGDPRFADLPQAHRKMIFEGQLREHAESVIKMVDGLVQLRLDQKMGKVKAAKGAVPAGSAMGGVSGVPAKDPDYDLWKAGKISDEEYWHRGVSRNLQSQGQ